MIVETFEGTRPAQCLPKPDQDRHLMTISPSLPHPRSADRFRFQPRARSTNAMSSRRSAKSFLRNRVRYPPPCIPAPETRALFGSSTMTGGRLPPARRTTRETLLR